MVTAALAVAAALYGGASRAAADCGWFCTSVQHWTGTYELFHPIRSSLPTGYRCHSMRCRVHRWEKGHSRVPLPQRDVPTLQGGMQAPRTAHRCIKTWRYRSVPYWHWRYYRAGYLYRVGLDHVGVPRTAGERCISQ